jgi:L-arabinose isomerase
MEDLKKLEVWFVTGSQHLYGEETLKQVAEHSTQIAKSIDKDPAIPVRVIFKPVVKSPEEIYQLCLDAHLLARQNVDRRLKSVAKTFVTPAHPV